MIRARALARTLPARPLLAIGTVFLLAPVDPASAQIVNRPGDEPIQAPEFEASEPKQPLIAPPDPFDDAKARDSVPRLESAQRVRLAEVRIVGNTTLPEAPLANVAERYVGREVSYGDIAQLRDALTAVYVEHGYVTSGAVVPDQSLDDGILEVRVIEGVLADIEIETDGRYRDSAIARRLASSIRGVVNVREIEEQLETLREDPIIASVQAELAPANERGQSILRVRIHEQRAYSASAEFNNQQNPSIGAYGGRVRLGFRNAIGYGDSFVAEYRGSEGLNRIEAAYEIPLPLRETRLGALVRRSWSEIVEAPFDRLDIEVEEESYGISLRAPIASSQHWRLEASALAAWRRTRSTLRGDGFSFVPGPENGKATVAVLRLGQDFNYGGVENAVALRSTLSVGLNILGATKHGGTTPDGQFVAWLAQAEWARRLGVLDSQLIARANVQLASSSLLPMERFAIGGRYTVRGYREAALARDNGATGTLEWRVPLWERNAGASYVELAPFVDAGYSWNADLPEIGRQTLVGLGVGLRVGLAKLFHSELYWAQSLTDAPATPSWDLQDTSVYFRFVARLP